MVPASRSLIVAIALALGLTGSAAATQSDARASWQRALWEVVYDLDDSAEVGSALRTSHFSEMHYFVGPFPDMLVMDSTPLFGRCTQSTIENGMEQRWTSSGRPRLPAGEPGESKNVLVGRQVKTCDASLGVQTEGSRRYRRPTPNTFVITNNFEWATAGIEYYMGDRLLTSASVENAAPVYTQTDQEVPYDYVKLVNQGRATLSGDGAPVIHQLSRILKYSVIRKPMGLEFLRQCEPGAPRPSDFTPQARVGESPPCVPDLIGTPWLVHSDCTRVDEYFCVFNRFHFIHPNVAVRLKIDGEDVTRFLRTLPDGTDLYFHVRRLHRAFESGLKADDEGDGRYRDRDGWIEDQTGSPGPFPIWEDMPAPGELAPPAKWTRKRLLQEFLLGVKDFPEFGFLYYATMVDTKPGWYRVRKSRPKNITAEQWCRLNGSARPNWDGREALDDSGWRKAALPTR
jgi:hypothetical protein